MSAATDKTDGEWIVLRWGTKRGRSGKLLGRSTHDTYNRAVGVAERHSVKPKVECTEVYKGDTATKHKRARFQAGKCVWSHLDTDKPTATKGTTMTATAAKTAPTATAKAQAATAAKLQAAPAPAAKPDKPTSARMRAIAKACQGSSFARAALRYETGKIKHPPAAVTHRITADEGKRIRAEVQRLLASSAVEPTLITQTQGRPDKAKRPTLRQVRQTPSLPIASGTEQGMLTDALGLLVQAKRQAVTDAQAELAAAEQMLAKAAG